MKKPLHIIKTWFETGDVPTQQQFYDAFDSFHHKDNGEILTEKSVNAAGDVTFKFTDGDILTIEKFVPDVSKPMDYIDGLVNAINTITTDITTLQTGKVDKVDGKGLSDTNFSQAEKVKLANLENYIPPSSHPIDFIEGLQTVLDELAQNLTLKVNKEDGKGLSSNDYTTEEKQKLADLKQIWEDTPAGNIKPIGNKKVAINKDEADAALDIDHPTEEKLLQLANFLIAKKRSLQIGKFPENEQPYVDLMNLAISDANKEILLPYTINVGPGSAVAGLDTLRTWVWTTDAKFLTDFTFDGTMHYIKVGAFIYRVSGNPQELDGVYFASIEGGTLNENGENITPSYPEFGTYTAYKYHFTDYILYLKNILLAGYQQGDIRKEYPFLDVYVKKIVFWHFQTHNKRLISRATTDNKEVYIDNNINLFNHEEEFSAIFIDGDSSGGESVSGNQLKIVNYRKEYRKELGELIVVFSNDVVDFLKINVETGAVDINVSKLSVGADAPTGYKYAFDDNVHVVGSVRALDGIILQSPNGSGWKIVVDNTGNLSTIAIY